MSLHIAIVGSGQLAQMMAQSGKPMGFTFSFLADPNDDITCVDGLGNTVIRTDQSPSVLFEELNKPDIVTVEKEHVDIDLLNALSALTTVSPNTRALEAFKNRHSEKSFLRSLGIPIANYAVVTDKPSLEKAIETLQKPIFLKTQEEGYDGYNQFKVTDENAATIQSEIQFPGAWVAESFINFEREVSFLAARNTHGKIQFYPCVENEHHNGTLIKSIAPAPALPDALNALGQQYLTQICETLDYVGLICMECFLINGELVVNEIAPRVHNSGHWTLKGTAASQFENHIRAISGLPLGCTKQPKPCGMLNLLGVTVTAAQVTQPNIFLTLYGKAVKPRRKLGHINIVCETVADVKSTLNTLHNQAYNQ